MPNSLPTPSNNFVNVSNRMAESIPSLMSGRKVFCLVTDTWDYYQDLLKKYLFEDLVLISPASLLAKQGAEIRELLSPAKAVLLDWSVRSASLLNTLRQSRSSEDIPILALCDDQEADHVAALILGADGTIRRFFNPIMLEAKLVAYCRSIADKKRYENLTLVLPEDNDAKVVNAASENRVALVQKEKCVLRQNVAARKFCINDSRLPLTPIEYDLLTFLFENEGVCRKRDDVINNVWGIGYETGTNFLDVHIHAVRQKLKKAGIKSCIKTVRGIGYRFDSTGIEIISS